MNKVILLGRLTADPQLRYTNSDEPCAVCRYALAVSRKIKRDGEDNVDFVNCVVFGKPAEFANQYFKKGLQICVSGRLQIRNYVDKAGQKRTLTEVVIEEQDFAESRKAADMRNSTSLNVEELLDESDLPF